MLGLWLPATAHCSLQAMTDLLNEVCDHACSHDTSASHADACDVIEGGDFTAGITVAHAPAPSLAELACLKVLHARLLAEAQPMAPPSWGSDHPRDWVPSWTFALRAALPARAPNLT